MIASVVANIPLRLKPGAVLKMGQLLVLIGVNLDSAEGWRLNVLQRVFQPLIASKLVVTINTPVISMASWGFAAILGRSHVPMN